MKKLKIYNSNAAICDETGGNLMPIVNLNNCGAKEDCIAACPYDVFEMRPISKEDAVTLNFKGKLKALFFKNKAYVVDPNLCHACGLCVLACPEKAIGLVKNPFN